MMASLLHKLTSALFIPGLCLALGIFSASNALAGSCVDWPKAMAQSEIARMPAQGKVVLVQPFTDFAKKSGDEWLILGLRDYVTDLLRTSDGLRVLAGQSAAHSGQVGPPDFTVSGTFQHIGEKMRIFIKLQDAKTGQLLAQPDAVFLYPENQELFSKTAQAVKAVMKVMGVEPDSGRFDAVMNATSSTRAYENFAKGRQALEIYRPDKAGVAALFFTQAKREDYKSPLGYEGLIALYSFLALDKKSRGAGYTGELQKAEAELVQMQRLTKPGSLVFAYTPKKAVKKEAFKAKLDNRFLAGEAAYAEGTAIAQGDDSKAAELALRKATELVPEDALAWYHLSRTYTKLGDSGKAQEALQKAYEINPCIEK